MRTMQEIEERAFTPEVAEKLRRTFQVNDHVRFNMNDQVVGTGVVLGLALDHIIKSYIILLDEPRPAWAADQRAILCSNTLMEKLAD